VKIRTGAITAATALALALSMATPATAAPASTERTEGSFASATFVKKERVTCSSGSKGTRTITSSYDGDAMLTSGGKGDTAWSVEFDEAEIEVIVNDPCSGDVLTFFGAQLYRGGLPLFSKNAKSVDARASGVDINSPIPTEWYPQGRTQLHFTANSRPTKSKEQKREITAEGKTFTRSRTTVRNADATGAITLTGTGVDYLDGRNLIQGATLLDASFGTSTYTVTTRTRR
jgi:hypothetical protein